MTLQVGIPNPLSTGAVAIYVGTGKHNAPALLGTGRTAPRYLIERAWIPFFNDLGGSAMPFDELYAGTRALVSVDLNWLDLKVLKVAQAVPGSVSQQTGFQALLDQGSFMVAENLASPLWLRFLNYNKPAFRALGLAPGIRFPYSRLLGPDRHEPGTQSLNINLIWRCQRGFVPVLGGFLFADNDMTGLPPFPGLK